MSRPSRKRNGGKIFPIEATQHLFDNATMKWKSTHINGQKYASLKKECVKKGELFVDPIFPPNSKSLFYSKVDNDVVWKRPKELCKVPKLVVEGVTCDDLQQGALGNAWFVSACLSLARDLRLWNRVVPDSPSQEWSTNNHYAGIFHFQFWRYGQWIDVVVDDLLPTKDGELLFCHSSAKNEFWSALLEKAYAKVYGDYESLATGHTIDALVDFTGGVAERLDAVALGLDSSSAGGATQKTLEILREACDNNALVIAEIRCDPSEVGQVCGQGLRKGVWCGVTGVLDVTISRETLPGETLQLVRMYGGQDWSGPWSDGSDEMKSLTTKDKENLGITFSRERERLMTYEDFARYFTDISICHFVNTSLFSLKKSCKESLHYQEWTQGPLCSSKDRAGGDGDNVTFLANPQFVFDIPADDVIMVSLQQDDTYIGGIGGREPLQIGFHIMQVEHNRRYRVHVPGDKMAVSEYARLRSTFRRVGLARGRYVIIPTTKAPGQTGKFLLRLYSTKSCHSRELILEAPNPEPLCWSDPYAWVTKLTILGADGLETKTKTPCCPLVRVNCEGNVVKSSWVKDTSQPDWNFDVLFYRKKPSNNIEIEVFHHKPLKDEFLGVAMIVDEQGDEKSKRIELNLYGGKSKKEREVQRPGKLYVEISSSVDVTAL